MGKKIRCKDAWMLQILKQNYWNEKCFCIVNQDCYLSANTMLMCGQQWPPFMGQGVKLVVYPHQSGKNRWKANWVMYDNTVIQQKGGGVVNGSVRHVSDRWCIVNADIFLDRFHTAFYLPIQIRTFCGQNQPKSRINPKAQMKKRSNKYPKYNNVLIDRYKPHRAELCACQITCILFLCFKYF